MVESGRPRSARASRIRARPAGPLAASKATEASFAAPARAVATGSVAASPWAPEMAAQTFAEAAGVAAAWSSITRAARGGRGRGGCEAAMVRLFTCDAFVGACCPTRNSPHPCAAAGRHLTREQGTARPDPREPLRWGCVRPRARQSRFERPRPSWSTTAFTPRAGRSASRGWHRGSARPRRARRRGDEGSSPSCARDPKTTAARRIRREAPAQVARPPRRCR